MILSCSQYVSTLLNASTIARIFGWSRSSFSSTDSSARFVESESNAGVTSSCAPIIERPFADAAFTAASSAGLDEIDERRELDEEKLKFAGSSDNRSDVGVLARDAKLDEPAEDGSDENEL